MPTVNLFCLPYAGGSASIYNHWCKYLDPRIKLTPLEMAGRGSRISEPFYQSIPEAIADLLLRNQAELRSDPYALFGHSMGSWLAFELAHHLKANGYPQPVQLFLSGRYPPQFRKTERIYHTMSDSEVRNGLLRMGGTPPELLDCPEWWNLFIPVLRADYKILDTYHFEANRAPLQTSIVGFTGNDDDITNASQMARWQELTTGDCQVYTFEGAHFFIHTQTAGIAKIINEKLINPLAVNQ